MLIIFIIMMTVNQIITAYRLENSILIDDSCKIKIGHSIFKGLVQKTKLNDNFEQIKYCSFQGIPYAYEPKRFEVSNVKNVDWYGERRFTRKSEKCAQVEEHRIAGTENCLTLDIFVPITSKYNQMANNKSTIVWIHGGSYNMGSAKDELKNIDRFMEKDIIVVTINYRLGLFGFFCLPNEIRRKNSNPYNQCNLGLKDQRTALKWIKQYIKYFGGNSKDITLGGFSAGSSSVIYHLLYSKKLLFQKAISISGTIINPWAYYNRVQKSSLDFCENLRISDYNLTILQELPLQRLEFGLRLSDSYFKFFGNEYSTFLPTLEDNEFDNVDDDELRITIEPHEMIKNQTLMSSISDRVPLLLGFTSSEETCDAIKPYQYLNENFRYPYQVLKRPNKVNGTLQINKIHINFKKYIEKLRKTRQFEEILHLRENADMLFGIINFLKRLSSSQLQESRTVNVTKLLLMKDSFNEYENEDDEMLENDKNNSIYVYKFSIPRVKLDKQKILSKKKYFSMNSFDNNNNSGCNNGDKWWKKISTKKAFHQDDIKYLFDGNHFDQNNSKILFEYWSNFIKYGNPNKNPNSNLLLWPSYSPLSSPTYQILNVKERKMTIEKYKPSKLYNLWKFIYNCFYYMNCETKSTRRISSDILKLKSNMDDESDDDDSTLSGSNSENGNDDSLSFE